MLRSNSKQSGKSIVKPEGEKGKAAVGRISGFAEKEGFKPRVKE